MSVAACGDDDTNDEETDAAQDIVADAGMDDTSMDDTSMDDTSMDDTSMDDTSMDDTSMDDTSMDDTSMDDTAEEDAVVVTSLRDDVFPIIESSCGGCHTRGTPVEDWEGAVDEGTYFDEVGDLLARVGDDPRMNSIVRGDAANSGFIGVLEQRFTFGDFNLVMPPEQSGAPPMRAADVAVVVAWIDEGALDN